MRHELDLDEKNVLVVGLGKSGLAACRFLTKQKAHVSLVDEKKRSALKPLLKKLPRSVSLLLGKKRFSTTSFDLIVVSPGVPWDHPDLVRARDREIPVIPEFELAWSFVRPKKTIAVTGTNGKTTTTALLGSLLKKSNIPVVVGGNIGTPLSDLVPRISKKHVLVLEVSSYQIEAHQIFHPDVGVWLNLTPDHLKRHKTMARYAKIKARLFSHATPQDVAVLNRADKWVRAQGKRLKIKKIWFPTPQLKKLASRLPLPGQHNLENAMAAAAAAKAIGVSDLKIRKALHSFKGVPHRLQPVGRKKGVHFINDSKSTNVDSTIVALKAMTSRVFLILGGRHKGSSYKFLIPALRKRVKTIFSIGEASRLIQRDLRKTVPVVPCGTLEKAVRLAAKAATPGQTVLLSPACASFDQYKNFEERGDHFQRLVKRLWS